MKSYLLFWVGVLLAILTSCTESKQPPQEGQVKAQLPKPQYTIDLHVWHRRDATTAHTWPHISNGAKVHYMKHKLVPMFRLFSAALVAHDTLYEYQLEHAVLKTYCGKALLETNKKLRFGGTENYIYSGQDGLLDCTDREELSFKVYYRRRGDTLSTIQVDSLKYEIILDGGEYFE